MGRAAGTSYTDVNGRTVGLLLAILRWIFHIWSGRISSKYSIAKLLFNALLRYQLKIGNRCSSPEGKVELCVSDVGISSIPL